MKNFVLWYSEQAIKVSDSYCSGPSNQADIPPHAAAPATQTAVAPSTQTAVTSVYKVKLSNEKPFLIRLSWGHQAFSIAISDYPFPTTKLSRSFKTLSRQRGSESFETVGLKAAVFWDLRRARFDNNGPEPVSGFYVAVLVDTELSLMLGDMEQEFEATKCVSDFSVPEFSLFSRGERFSGDGVFSTTAKFSEAGRSHDIFIKFSREEGTTSSWTNPFLSVCVDKKSVIEEKSLQWNFRGNQTIFLDGLLIDLMWDVHNWLFNPSSASAVFLFRTRRGLDSRLWLEEKNLDQEKVGFSILIFACKNPD